MCKLYFDAICENQILVLAKSLNGKHTEYRIQNTEFISHMYIHVMHYNNNNNYRKIS